MDTGRTAIKLLGPPQLRVDGRLLQPRPKKALGLLGYLLAEGGAHHRDKLAALLWPDDYGSRARAALRGTLASARRMLGASDGRPGNVRLLAAGDSLSLELASSSEVDLRAVEAAYAVSRGVEGGLRGEARAGALGRLEAAVAAYRGDFLEGFYLDDAPEFDYWATVQREAWRSRMDVVFDRLSGLRLEEGEFAEALDACAAWVARDPLNEAAHRRLMRARAAGGDRAGALRAFERCRSVLEGELGMQPATETRSLASAIRSGHAAGPRPSPDHDLPAQPTAIVGREGDLASLVRSLPGGEGRLFTLAGPPGVGKTRLAVAAAKGLIEAGVFEHGAWFVDLAPIRDPRLVLPAVARVLGAREAGRLPPLDALKLRLREKRTLLLLDNFEHLLAAAPEVEELLACCPGLTVLATSREALRVRRERVVPVAPLALPDPHAPTAPEPLGAAPAVRLFAERARAVRPGFRLTRGNAHAVAELCRRLDGLPLAIELAAARADLLAPRDMLERLGERLPLPGPGPRGVPERHRTLPGAVAWSYELLSPADRAVFRKLGVFAGGFTAEAARAVACPPGVDALEALASLTAKSLVQSAGPPEEGQPPRYAMLETLREFAMGRLDAPHGP